MPRLVTVKQAVSDASMEIGISQKPVSSVMGTADQDIAQMTALLSAVADEVLSASPYEEALSDGYWLITEEGTRVDRPQADEDVILFDARLCINGLKFRFLQAKGLEFGEQLRDFTARQNRLAAEANARVLDLNYERSVVQ